MVLITMYYWDAGAEISLSGSVSGPVLDYLGTIGQSFAKWPCLLSFVGDLGDIVRVWLRKPPKRR